MPYSPRGGLTVNITATSPRAGTSNLTQVLRLSCTQPESRFLESKSKGKPPYNRLNTGYLLATPTSVDTKGTSQIRLTSPNTGQVHVDPTGESTVDTVEAVRLRSLRMPSI